MGKQLLLMVGMCMLEKTLHINARGKETVRGKKIKTKAYKPEKKSVNIYAKTLV